VRAEKGAKRGARVQHPEMSPFSCFKPFRNTVVVQMGNLLIQLGRSH
jgi:hypothetical protein